MEMGTKMDPIESNPLAAATHATGRRDGREGMSKRKRSSSGPGIDLSMAIIEVAGGWPQSDQEIIDRLTNITMALCVLIGSAQPRHFMEEAISKATSLIETNSRQVHAEIAKYLTRSAGSA